jgi:hypothetical protein
MSEAASQANTGVCGVDTWRHECAAGAPSVLCRSPRFEPRCESRGDRHGERTSRVDLSHRRFEMHLSCRSHQEGSANICGGIKHVSETIFINKPTHDLRFLGLLVRPLLRSRLQQGLGATAATKRVWLAGQLAGQPAGSGATRTVGGLVWPPSLSGCQWS